jgi:hypothetical protein
MSKHDPATFHKLYGVKAPRVVYYKRDFLDYMLMIVLCALAMALSYGFNRPMSILGLALCAFTVAMFVMRHGIEFRVPAILRRPQDVLYLFAYKLQNLTAVYFIAVALLLLENLLIALTPNLPHHVDSMRKVALYLFYIHFISITLYRTIILIDHLAKKELVREVLMQTAWRRAVKEKTNMTLEILHAYCTGVLAHAILIAPWYVVITHARFSVIFLPVVCLINIVVHLRWAKVLNAWFYRDHWLGHNSELEFLFLHGTHHDAIPSGLIAVAENGFLEGFLRHTMGFPVPCYNPAFAFLVYMYEIKMDIDQHQYIPGVFPKLSKRDMETYQHSTHHYGPLEPYSLGSYLDYEPEPKEDASTNVKKPGGWLPDEIRNSIKLDKELTDFQWDNPTYRKTLSLWDKYQT